MWQQAFTAQSPYRRGFRLAAIAWTALLLGLCFLPGRDIPDIHIPLADKWVHFILFGTFAVLWLLSGPPSGWKRPAVVVLAAVALGWLVEVMQGQLAFLGRTQDNTDTLADALGGLIGVIAYCAAAHFASKKRKQEL